TDARVTIARHGDDDRRGLVNAKGWQAPRQVAFLEESLAHSQGEIDRCLVPFRDAVALLQTIPGVSAPAAATIVAGIGGTWAGTPRQNILDTGVQSGVAHVLSSRRPPAPQSSRNPAATRRFGRRGDRIGLVARPVSARVECKHVSSISW